jgi:peptidoglycan/LPS O-acetylase OafA/YrhL
MGPLDGLRAAAILIVMVSHAGFGNVIPGGFGVTIFFFLSGFLISTLLRLEIARSGTIDYREFYRRRIYRIIPPFLITILVCAIVAQFDLFPHPPTVSGVITDLLFLTNYAPQIGAGRGFPIPLWSLDVEEHFYLLFPTILLIASLKLKRLGPPVVIVSLCGMILAVRLYNVFELGIIEDNYYWSHTRMDSILFGCLLAVWNNPVVDPGAWKPRWVHFAFSIAVLMACFLVRSPEFRESIRYSLQGCALFVLFSYVLQERGPIAAILSSWPLRLVAVWSYTLYLIHVPAFAVAEAQWPALGTPIAAIPVFAFSVAYAATMRWLVEKPLLAQRRRKSLMKREPDPKADASISTAA